MDLGLKDKRAFIAGSSRGLGYATALTLAREGCRSRPEQPRGRQGQSGGGGDH